MLGVLHGGEGPFEHLPGDADDRDAVPLVHLQGRQHLLHQAHPTKRVIVEQVAGDIRRPRPAAHQVRRHLEGVGAGRVVAEGTGVGADRREQTLRRPGGQLRPQGRGQVGDHFAGGGALRFDPAAIAEADIALVMVNDRQRPETHQLPALPAQPPLVAAVQTDADQVVAGPGNELPHPGHVGLRPAGARQKPEHR